MNNDVGKTKMSTQVGNGSHVRGWDEKKNRDLVDGVNIKEGILLKRSFIIHVGILAL